jgi:hypothetical protein
MRVEAGLNRLLLPSPARSRPADTGSTRLHPTTGHWGGPVWPRLGALALCQARSKARDAQVRGRNARSDSASLSRASCRRRSCGSGIPRPAGHTFGAAAPLADAASHLPAWPRRRPLERERKDLDAITPTRGSAAASSPPLRRNSRPISWACSRVRRAASAFICVYLRFQIA